VFFVEGGWCVFGRLADVLYRWSAVSGTWAWVDDSHSAHLVVRRGDQTPGSVVKIEKWFIW
jgi:hypothetical protein